MSDYWQLLAEERFAEIQRGQKIIDALKADRERLLTISSARWRERIVEVLQKYNVRLEPAPRDALVDAVLRFAQPRDEL